MLITDLTFYINYFREKEGRKGGRRHRSFLEKFSKCGLDLVTLIGVTGYGKGKVSNFPMENLAATRFTN